MGTLAVTVTKVVELTSGIFMGALSLLLLFGAYEPVNELATRYLQALDGIHHILAGLNGIVNPLKDLNFEEKEGPNGL